ncbi:DUF4097 family beta strand repeat-containing protein [Gorillibacterium sp. sgz5001074]|uniref:DUF4097 family beta strand repeat-containing protein n=1 Tax=Gorillibacterium sp. sgz5001074 TaxID=3446695 RepID=UPI003F66561F
MLKVGRYTAALLLVTSGVLLLIDQRTGSDHLLLLLDWWPLLLIMLGLEYLIFNFINRRGERQLRMDVGGLLLSVLVSAVVVGTTQSDVIPSKWLRELDFNIDTLKMSFSSEEGYSFDKETVHVPLAEGTSKIIFDNPNGSVEMKAGPVTDVEVKAVVWVDKVDETEARQVADQSQVTFTDGGTVRITASGHEYTGGFTNKRKPRMNLTVTVPADKLVNYELQLRNGRIAVNGLKVKEELKARTTNGAIALTDIQGSVSAGTTNGAVDIARATGSVTVDTTNGAVTAKEVGGKLNIDTTNGSVSVEQAGGPVDVDTTNGKISVREAAAGVKADATNGSITVYTHTVGGPYELDNMAGSIDLKIPSTAHVDLKGSANGSISTNLPFKIESKKITGQLGSGQYAIKLDTNSKIEVNRID